MAKRKFGKRAFKNWLDTLAKICIKTRDDFTCQIKREGCSGTMQPLDFNCQWCHIKSKKSNDFRFDMLNALCGCAHCHAWAHANPVLFGVWFIETYPYRAEYINRPTKIKTWREDDFKKIEAGLLQKAIDLEIDSLIVPVRYRKRFMKKIKEFVDEQ